MEEKRKNKRLPISLELSVSSLFKQDNVKVDVKDAPIVVTDISKGGIGFESESIHANCPRRDAERSSAD